MKNMMLALMALALLSGCGLQNQVNDLKSRADHDETAINDLYARLNALNSALASTNAQLISLGSQQASGNAALQGAITTLQGQQATLMVQIATLQGYKNIVAIKDPCGTQGAYNEVFLQLANGNYLASFSDNANGLNTRFTVLTDGTFTTTDGTHCSFTVSGGGKIISNEHN